MPDDPLLDSLTSDALEHGPERGPQKVSYTHEGLIELMVAHPELSQGALAKHFGYTAAWISTIICSDAFQARLAQRREEIIDPILRLTVEERFKALVNRSFEVLQEKLSGPASTVSDVVAIRVAEMGGKVLAVRAAQNPGPPALPPGERLSKLAGRLRELQRGDPPVDVEAKEKAA